MEGSGRNAIFLPYIGNTILPDTEETQLNKSIKGDYKKLGENYKEYGRLLQDKETVKNFENSGLFNKEDIEFMREGIHKYEKTIIEDKDVLVKNIRQAYEKLSKA